MAKSTLKEETASDPSSDTCYSDHDKEILDQTHGYRLGSDDPFWPHYLKEAEKYDDMMVDKWEKKMDTLLLFATLFSAIVTAFVIESSHSLQPDNAAITAAAIVEIVGILRNRSVADQPDPILQSPDGFQPNKSAFVVNLVWFVSLCLSITVALLAGLAKQWCNSLRWDRTAPPCNQARIRQARLNNWTRGQTELVISAIRVIMDAALGLFLIGLLVFLRDLDRGIYLAALVATVLTGAFYFITTLAPCFVSFCPYATPLSSRKTWGVVCQLWLAIANWVRRHILGKNTIEVEANLKKPLSPCEKKEKNMASTTSPDRLTGDSLSWIILHSQKPEPREMAIRAIATLNSKEALKQLGSPEILPQVIQSFTSCFIIRGTKDGKTKFGIQESTDVDTVSLHGRALTVLVAQSVHASNNEEVGFAESGWVMDPIIEVAVKDRFEYLGSLTSHETRGLNLETNTRNQTKSLGIETKHSTKAIEAPDCLHDNDGNLAHVMFQEQVSETDVVTHKVPTGSPGLETNHEIPSKDPNITTNPEKATEISHLHDQNLEARVWALIGLSVWHDFIGYDEGLRFNQGTAICDLAKSLEWSLSSGLRKEVLHTLTKELSYWAPTISTTNRKETLQHLVKLIPKTPPELQPQFACTLSVLVLKLNHSTSYLVPPSSNSRGRVPEEENGHGAAVQLMSYYTNKPEQLAEDGQPLLLFALTGLMEYYEHCDFDQEAHDSMKQIAQRFQELDGLGKLQSLNIPVQITLPTSGGTSEGPINPCNYYVSTLLLYLKRPRTQPHSQQMDEVFTYLLRSINRERQSRELIQYGSQIIPIVAQVLSQTKDAELQAECLRTMVSYWDSGPSFLYVQIVLFYEVPAKLVQLIEHRTQKLAENQVKKMPEDQGNDIPRPSESSNSILLSAASEVFNKIGDQARRLTKFDEERLVSSMNSIMHNGLLWVLLEILDLHIPLPQGDISSVRTLRDVRTYLEGRSGSMLGVDQLLKIMVEGYDAEQTANALQHWQRSGLSEKGPA